MLMKARDDAGKPALEAAAQSAGPGPSKMEKEGQRPTQPVYQIQNRGMGPSASSSVMDREFLIIIIINKYILYIYYYCCSIIIIYLFFKLVCIHYTYGLA